jgi:Leucine Rich repeat
MWDHTANMDSMISNFKEELNEQSRSSPVEGSWELNYRGVCDKLNTTGCPFFIADKSNLRVQNCIVDLSSWRCMLLALTVSIPNITEISLHNCRLSAQHIVDLVCTLIQSEKGPKMLRLEYLHFENDDERAECFRAMDHLFTSDVKLEFLSLRGNSLTDDFFIRNAPSLQSNINLKVLNLSCNEITDLGATAIFRSLRVNMTLKELSVAKNKITGNQSFEIFSLLFLGSPFTTEDEAVMKTMTRLLTETNKKIKEVNKKRRKSNLPESPDFVVPRRDPSQKINGQSIICNRSLIALDMSYNPLNSIFIASSLENVKDKVGSTTLVSAFGPCCLSLLLNLNPSFGPPNSLVSASTISELGSIGITVKD